MSRRRLRGTGVGHLKSDTQVFTPAPAETLAPDRGSHAMGKQNRFLRAGQPSFVPVQNSTCVKGAAWGSRIGDPASFPVRPVVNPVTQLLGGPRIDAPTFAPARREAVRRRVRFWSVLFVAKNCGAQASVSLHPAFFVFAAFALQAPRGERGVGYAGNMLLKWK